jgi:putative membrane protein
MSSRKRLPPHVSLLSGALMGSADAVPGVSGGTIALIIGIYERFIDSLSTMIRSPLSMGSRAGRKQVYEALAFLVPLGVGLAAAYYLVTKLLVGATDSPGVLRRPETAPILYGFFFGLVAVSLREPWRRIKIFKPQYIVAATLGAAAALAFVGLPYSSGEPATWMLLVGGAGAISVMLLPGVSGSLFLVIIGQYTMVAAAVHDRDFGILIVFLAGIGLGALLFVPLLRYLLHHRHDLTMAALTGLMAGSLRALWPWKDNYDPKVAPMVNQGIGDQVALVAAAAVAGGAVVWLLAQLERRVLEAEAQSESDESPS